MKKYTDVDIVAELQKLVDSHVDSYKEDFDIDKRMMLSRLVDTFFSRTSWTMLLYAENHSISVA